MRYLGLDLGTKTLGISISDKTNTISTPLVTLRFNENDFESILKELEKVVLEKEITDFVLGLPKNMNNTLGFASERSLKFKNLLEKKFKMPVHLIDERLSTVEAEHILINSNKSRKKRKKIIDNVASSIILDTFLKGRKEKDER